MDERDSNDEPGGTRYEHRSSGGPLDGPGGSEAMADEPVAGPGGTGETESPTSDADAGPGGTLSGEDDDDGAATCDEAADAGSEPGGDLSGPRSASPAPEDEGTDLGPGGTGISDPKAEPRGADEPAPCGDEGREWFRSSDDVRKGVIQLSTGSREVEYSVIGDRAVFEGDIVLGHVADVEAPGSGTGALRDAPPDVEFGIGITGEQYRWPRGVIPYEIDPNLPQSTKTIIDNAITHWHDNTLIRLRPRNGEGDYLRFISDDGCWSYVGRRGGRQEISIDTGCGFGATVHEIGHAVGLWHEQSREDRDEHVTIHWENIQEGREHNFNQHITDGDDIGGYDYDSIMHYGERAFSKNGLPTIETHSGQDVGQRIGLSAGDRAAVATLYPAHEITAHPNLRYGALWSAGTQAQVWWPLCSESQFRAKTSQLWKTMRVKQMHAVVLGGKVRYACMWERGTFGQVWWPSCSEAQFREMTAKLWGWARPAQVQAFVVGKQVRYSCLWNQGTHDQLWWPNCSEAQFRDVTSRYWKVARPFQAQAFVVGKQVRYSCLWNRGTFGQVWWPNCSETQFRQKTAQLWSWARPAQLQPFTVGGKTRYSCLWNAGTQPQVWWPRCTEEQVRQKTGSLWSSMRPAQWYPVAV